MDQKIKRTRIFTEIDQAAEQMRPDLSAWRRDFHRYAETGFHEMRTASLIARKLKDLGYEVQTGEEVLEKSVLMALPKEEACRAAYERAKREGADPEYLERMKDGLTGVIGILRCGEGPVVALRFDIDALPIPESDSPEHFPAREGFASIHPGCMHACGHDGHAAIGLGTAAVLARLKDQIHGTVKLLFQPAEEGVGGGAKGMVAKGHLDDVMYMIGSHITTTEGHEAGRLYPGNHGALATTKWKVRFTGKSAHAGAYPHLGKDALLAACCAVMNLNAIPRHGKGATRIGVGRFFDESAINSISDDVRFSFEVRGATNELREYMLEKARRVIEAAAQMYDCTVTFEQLGEAGSFSSSPAMMQRIRRVCKQDLHLEVTQSDSMRSEGSEDVSFLIEKTQENGGEASFMRLLTTVQGCAHGRTYDFDEELLADGVKVFAGVVCDICAF